MYDVSCSASSWYSSSTVYALLWLAAFRARLMVSPAAGCMAMPCHIELIIKLAHIIGWLISWLLG